MECQYGKPDSTVIGQAFRVYLNTVIPERELWTCSALLFTQALLFTTSSSSIIQPIVRARRRIISHSGIMVS
jgi:hypothetical protein